MGIIISQYKDPYKPISIMEGHKGFERCWSAIVDSEVSMSLCVASQHHFTPVAFGEILTPKPNKKPWAPSMFDSSMFGCTLKKDTLTPTNILNIYNTILVQGCLCKICYIS